MFEIGDKVKVNAKLSDEEINEILEDCNIYSETRNELFNREYFTVKEVRVFDLRCRTKRETSVRLPKKLFEKSLLEEGEEL